MTISGPNPVIVLKETGKCMSMSAYADSDLSAEQIRTGGILDVANSKGGSPRVPVVAAKALLTGIPYEECLAAFNKLTSEQKRLRDDSYVNDNMGYGIEAWTVYKAACDECKAAGLPIVPD